MRCLTMRIVLYVVVVDAHCDELAKVVCRTTSTVASTVNFV